MQKRVIEHEMTVINPQGEMTLRTTIVGSGEKDPSEIVTVVNEAWVSECSTFTGSRDYEKPRVYGRQSTRSDAQQEVRDLKSAVWGLENGSRTEET